MAGQLSRLQRPEEMLTLFETELGRKSCRNVAITNGLLQLAKLDVEREIQPLLYYLDLSTTKFSLLGMFRNPSRPLQISLSTRCTSYRRSAAG